MSHTLSPPKPLMPQPNHTNSAQPHRVTPGPPTDTPVSSSSRSRAWQLPERDVVPFEDLDVCGESSTREHLARFRRQMSRRDPNPGCSRSKPESGQRRPQHVSFVALGLGKHQDHPAVLLHRAAVNEPQGMRRHAREHRIGLLVAAIAAAFALAGSAAELSDPT